MCSQKEAISILRKATERYNILFPGTLKESYLYGSYARGEYTSESDVDILFSADILPEEICRYRDGLAKISSDLSLDHDITVSLTIKPADQFNRYSDAMPFYRNVKKEGIRYDG